MRMYIYRVLIAAWTVTGILAALVWHVPCSGWALALIIAGWGMSSVAADGEHRRRKELEAEIGRLRRIIGRMGN